MEAITNGTYVFEIVDSVPWGYRIWNIGENMPAGYLPLVQTGGYNGRQVNTLTMKAIKVEEAQTVLAAIGWGTDTVKEMEAFIQKNENSNNESSKYHAERLKSALKVMRDIKGIENLQS